MKALNIATCHLIESGHRTNSPIVEISGRCLYHNGEYSIYKHCDRAFYFLWHNVIVSEFGGINREMADSLATNQKPVECWECFLFNNIRSHIAEAPELAKEYNFTITPSNQKKSITIKNRR